MNRVDGNPAYQMNNWMSSLSENAKQQPLNTLKLPGTHDSAAYILDFNQSLSGSSSSIKAGSFFASRFSFIRKIISDWTLTQEVDIKTQLEIGIRQLDARVAYSEKENKFYLMHTFVCLELEEFYKEIGTFLDKNQEEVIVVNMKPDWENRTTMTKDAEIKLFDFTEKFFEEKLAPALGWRSKALTLNVMVKNKWQIIFSYTSQFNLSKDFNWDPSSFNIPWHDNDNLDSQVEFIKEDLKGMNLVNNKFNGILFTLTPSTSTIVGDVFARIFCCCREPNSIKSITEAMHNQMNLLIEEHPNDIKDKVSIIISDFMNKDLVRSVTSLNEFQNVKQSKKSKKVKKKILSIS